MVLVDNDRKHKQVPAKVKAYVDEGIKELVEILNTFDGLWTTESCQGRRGELAFVNMEYGEEGTNFKEMANFTYRLAKKLSQIVEQGMGISPEPIYDLELSIKWRGDKRHPFISIEMPPSCIKQVANVFTHVRDEFGNNKCYRPP